MGTSGEQIPCDLEDEVLSQFRVFHHRDGDVVGKPILFGSDDNERDMPIPME
jgi:hypothetical protein